MMFLLLLILLTCCVGKAISTTDPKQIDALVDLYSSADGPNWSWIDNNAKWQISYANNVYTARTDPCTSTTGWEGVLCAPSAVGDNDIVKLNLTSHNLHGPLVDSIGKLSTLKILTLNENQLTGSM